MLSTHRQERFWSSIRQIITRDADRVARLPRWRHPLVGFLIGFLFVGLGLAGGLVEAHILSPVSFPGVFFTLGVVIVALLWGVVPAIFTILLSLLVLDYLYIPPFGTFGGYGWSGTLQLLTFAAIGIVLALLTHERETARMKAMAAEREAVLRAQQLEATFEAMNDSVVIYSKQGQVLQTNRATRRLFGLSCLSAKDEPHVRQEILFQAAQCDDRGQLLAEKRRPFSRLLKGERLTSASTSDVLVTTPDGRKVMLNMSGAPIYDETGLVERVILIYRDVTERRRLEQRTSDALQALLAMAETLAQFVNLPSQEEGGIRSEQELMGRQMVELVRSVVESEHVVMLAVEPGKDEPEKEIIQPVTAVGFTRDQEQQWRERLKLTPDLADYVGNLALLSQLRDDQVISLDGMLLPLYTHILPYYVCTVLVAPICVEQRLVGMLCVDSGSREHSYTRHEMALLWTVARLTALTLARAHYQRGYAETRAKELALHEANRRMEEFISIICHELKTPLTVMKGSIQLAERKVRQLFSKDAPTPEEVKRSAPVLALLERARNQCIVQDRLVNDLLDVSRIQRQTLKLLMGKCDLAKTAQEAVDLQRQIVPSRTIHLMLPTQKEVPVYGDADRLVQVVTNYLTNAIKYSPADQPVEVALAIEDQEVKVLVRDRGPGLAEEEHERIWDRFYRAPGIERQDGSGLGLGVGLHICRTIIEQHGGQVGVESNPGKGSLFWFTLPLSGATT
ncbi:MAG TPA: ATP-binding protein [Ktedonobacteraceae bacterium]|nr:ATP-binding protein [Ktedonobacteraceae bacterium]